jgi:phospholipid transport system transporter-binding protein
MSALTRENDVLRVRGDISYDNADALCTEGLALLAQAGTRPVVDLAGMTAASSVAVAVLLRWARATAARGQQLRLAQVPERCRAIVRVSGLAEALPEV